MVLRLHATRLGPPRPAGEARSLKREIIFMDEMSLSEREVQSNNKSLHCTSSDSLYYLSYSVSVYPDPIFLKL